MRRIRKLLLILLIFILLLPMWSATAETPPAEADKGEFVSKDEVIYAKLSATGNGEEVYVVNILDVTSAGKIFDQGQYTALKNLTDLSPVEQQPHETVMLEAPEGKFYYQGSLEETNLPWDITIAYFLDGETIVPEELAGQDGQVQIRITTSANEQANPVFYANYLLQISVALDLNTFTNIEAPDGMQANAGENRQITFTVLPDQESELVIEADVVDFELTSGIDIAAIPASLPIDAPDIGAMISDMDILASAIADLHVGVSELLDGVTTLNSGVGELRDGSKQYHDGITTLSASSSELVGGSAEIGMALETLSQALEGSLGEMELGDLSALGDGLKQLADGLQQLPEALETLSGHFAVAYETLDGAMNNIPEHDLSEAQVEQLYMSGADAEVVKQLLDTYAAARTAKGTYLAVKEAFDAVGGTLTQVNESLGEMGGQLTAIADGLSNSQDQVDQAGSFAALQQGIAELALHYRAFQSGLEQFAGGVSQLSGSYGSIHQGIVELSSGTQELESGVKALHGGTAELSAATSDLPEQMSREVDEMLADYDRSDFEAVSFVSPDNDKINSVQFVLRTESITMPEPVKNENRVEEKKGFWTLFTDLFRNLF